MSDFERNDMLEEESVEIQTAEVGKKKAKGNKKKTKGKKVEGKLSVAFVALALMFITFVVLVVLEDKIVNSGEKINVVVAIAEVPAGLELTRENMPGYFTVKLRNKEEIPMGVTTYSKGTPIIGRVTDRVIHANEVITNECFYEGSLFEDIEDAVELSIDLGAIGQTVGGTLRPGDRVDIKAVIKIDKNSMLGNPDYQNGILDFGGGDMGDVLNMDPIAPVEGEVVEEVDVVEEETNAAASEDAIVLGQDGMLQFAQDAELSYGITGDYVSQVIAENVVVVDVFNSGGETVDAVEKKGLNMVATVINVAVPADLVDAILIAQAEGTLSFSRIHEDKEMEEDVSAYVNSPVEEMQQDVPQTEEAPAEVPAQ